MAVLGDLARYRDIEVLGAGGMATVVLAEDTLLQRQVALKRMNVHSDVRGLSRLRREALIGASVSHPNLVSIYDIVTDEDGGIVIVMEYVDGETLRDAVSRRGRLGSEEALRILAGVASGLDTIHKRGIVHRDVKPANVLLGAGGTVKLADLGIAAVPDGTRITTAGGVLGSFSYMAPEQLKDSPATPAIDVYALGAVAYELLSGQRARREPNPLALAHAIANQPPPDIREEWPEAPPAAAKLLVSAMASDPARRPRSASDLVRRLRAAFDPHNTVPVLTPNRTVPVARKRAGGAAGTSGAAAGAAAVGGAAGSAAAGGAARAAAGSVKPQSASTRVSPTPQPDGPPAPPRTSARTASGSRDSAPSVYSVSRRRRMAILPIALAAVALIVIVALVSGGSQPAKHGAAASGGGGSAQTSGPAPNATGRASSSRPTSSRAATASSGSGTSTSATAGARTGAVSSGSGTATSATDPVSNVESFYRLAASHRYADAWALADSTFRSQLGGYASFAAGQAGDRSITFNDAHLVNRSAGAATVAVNTTSVRTAGTDHCSGTVDLRPGAGSASWLLHMIHINCT